MELKKREEVIKALEHCIKDTTCEQCNYSPSTCFIQENALSLINELTEEVADLKAIAEGYQKLFEDCYEDKAKLTEDNESLKTQRMVLAVGLKDLRKEIKAIKADTVRKMQERLIKWWKAQIEVCVNAKEEEIIISAVDQIAKEMLEGKE